MKLLITYLLIFFVAGLTAQSIGDEMVLNRVAISNGELGHLSLDGTLEKRGLKMELDSTAIVYKGDAVQGTSSRHVFANYMNIYSDGEFRASLNVVSGTYLKESDRRAKKDIRVLKDGALKRVMQLEPISYLMKNQANKDRSIGLIAQDVREVFPILVHHIDGKDLLALSYMELIPVLIKALQEQQNIIQNLKENQHMMQKEFAVFQLQLARMAEHLAGKETAFQNSAALVAQNQ